MWQPLAAGGRPPQETATATAAGAVAVATADMPPGAQKRIAAIPGS